MVPEQETPCTVLFESLKAFANISNRDVAEAILSDRPVAGGRSPRQRIDDRSYLSRMVVHSKPGDLTPAMFIDFQQAAHSLFSIMHSTARAGLSVAAISAFLSERGARNMAAACRTYGLDGALYLNTTNRIYLAEDISDTDRAYLLVLLFLETGCQPDTRYAAQHALSVMEREFNVHPRTQATQSIDRPAFETEEDIHLALLRVKGNRMHGHAYILSIEPEGTEIGYLSTARHSITDVEETVSRHHLRLFRADNGCWYAHGLHSRNGTTLISGGNRVETVIEPPRDASIGFQRQDVPIQPGDRLKLARDTIFIVVRIDSEAF